MKARIKKTGEIINIASYAKIALDKCNSYGTPIEVRPEDVELIANVKEDEHWQDVKERAAIAAMHGALANCYLHEVMKLFVLWQKQRTDVNILYGVEIN